MPLFDVPAHLPAYYSRMLPPSAGKYSAVLRQHDSHFPAETVSSAPMLYSPIGAVHLLSLIVFAAHGPDQACPYTLQCALRGSYSDPNFPYVDPAAYLIQPAAPFSVPRSPDFQNECDQAVPSLVPYRGLHDHIAILQYFAAIPVLLAGDDLSRSSDGSAHHLSHTWQYLHRFR